MDDSFYARTLKVKNIQPINILLILHAYHRVGRVDFTLLVIFYRIYLQVYLGLLRFVHRDHFVAHTHLLCNITKKKKKKGRNKNYDSSQGGPNGLYPAKKCNDGGNMINEQIWIYSWLGVGLRTRQTLLPYLMPKLVLLTRFSLILSLYSSLSSIVPSRSSKLHPVSAQSNWRRVFAGRPTPSRPCGGILWWTSLMSSWVK